MSYDENMSDDAIVEMINEQLAEDGRVNLDYVSVESINGKPVLTGRVGSDEELDIIDEVLTDVLEIEKYDNNIWVDDALAFEGNEAVRRKKKNRGEEDDDFEEDEESADDDDDAMEDDD